MTLKILNELNATGGLTPLDLHFAKLMVRLNGSEEPELALAAAMVSSTTGQGHICLDLRRLREHLAEHRSGGSPGLPSGLDEWSEALRKSRVVGLPGDYRPLVLDEVGRLYLYRYWEYQQRLADALRARIESPPADRNAAALRVHLDRLFPSAGGGEPDWQKVAALSSVWKTFCVVSGGPGTGKTTTVAKILALLIELASPGKLRIALAAPTGKAAARLQEAITFAKGRLDCAEEVEAAIPEEASTIHRLLGSIPGSPSFRHNGETPLAIDVLVVDEASMVDLPLMSKLVQAVPPKARLILLGDKDQLSSVEAGAVLGDICATGGKIVFSKPFADACEKACGFSLDETNVAWGKDETTGDCIIELQKSYRFSGASGIARFSRKVREKDADGAVAALRAEKSPDLKWSEIPSCAQLGKTVRDGVIQGFRAYLEEVGRLGELSAEDPNERLGRVFDHFERFRILCAVREGPCGVGELNLLAEAILEEAGLVVGGRRWYVGRPVLIKRNDYSLRLFNGDVGIFLPDVLSGSDHRVFFPGPEGTFRSFLPQRLPEHETVFAMTVHKSQGSEFDEVLLILPDRDSPIMTRELVYTAITRARKRVTVLASEQVLRQAVLRSTERLSGLSDALWG